MQETGGALADALTFLRIVVTPVIMVLILWAWPDTQIAILATVLFIIAALTDIFDDFFGGASRGALRRYGYLDDVADTILVVGVLVALGVVLLRNGMASWTWIVPFAILILREVIIGLTKGFELARFGWPDNPLSNAKAGFSMLGAALLVASPWLTQWIDMIRAGTDGAMAVYDEASPFIWLTGTVVLWIAALFSLVSGYKILSSPITPVADETDQAIENPSND